jgi:hypothetical protein
MIDDGRWTIDDGVSRVLSAAIVHRPSSIVCRQAIVHHPLSGRLQIDLVDIAPDPILARLEGLYDGVVGGVEVPGGVFVLGVVAATDVAAGEADAQVHPAIA